MIFEGNRIGDLKRWGDTLLPRTPQTAKGANGNDFRIISTGAGFEQLSVKANDFRMVWPIPANEVYANQNLASQQNPGWSN